MLFTYLVGKKLITKLGLKTHICTILALNVTDIGLSNEIIYVEKEI